MASTYQQPYFTADPHPPHPYPNPYYPPHRRRTCICCVLPLKLLLGVVLFLLLLILVLALALRPRSLQLHVESASLSAFNLSAAGVLRHNLTAELSVRNPNGRIGVYHDWLEADAYYGGRLFQWKPLPTFYQGHRNTTALATTLAGDTVVAGAAYLYEQQKAAGAFDVELTVYGWVRYKVGAVTTRKYRLRATCWLPGLRLGGGGIFQRTKCKKLL